MLPAFFTTILFSISAVSANRTTRLLGGVTANFWRITLASAFLGIWAHTMGFGLTGSALPFFVISGFVGFGVGDLALYQALPRIGSRLSILLVHCVAAPCAALAEWLWLGTTLTSVQVLASFTILVGVGLALAPDKQLRISRRILVTGILFGIIAALGQGFGAVLSRKAYQVASQAGEHIDGLTAAYQRIVAGWLVAALAYAMARTSRASPELVLGSGDWKGTKAWPWVILNALAGPTLGVGCFQWALATEPTGVVLPIVAITPIVIIPFARVMEGERPARRSLAGGLVAVSGAVLLATYR
jgi:drug/metabolite transporter (DMT)-like permease